MQQIWFAGSQFGLVCDLVSWDLAWFPSRTTDFEERGGAVVRNWRERMISITSGVKRCTLEIMDQVSMSAVGIEVISNPRRAPRTHSGNS